MLYRPSFYWPVRDIFRILGSIGVAEGNYNPVQENQMTEDFCLRMPKLLQRRMVRKLYNVDTWARHSCWVEKEYKSRIKSTIVSHPTLSDSSDTVFARYPLIVTGKASLLKRARKVNVELANWYSTPVHPLTGKDLNIVRYETGSCPNAEKRCREVITLPIHAAVKKRDIDRAVKFLNGI